MGRSCQLLEERRPTAAALPDSLCLHHRRAQVLLRLGQKEAFRPLRRARPGETTAQPCQSQLPQRYSTVNRGQQLCQLYININMTNNTLLFELVICLCLLTLCSAHYGFICFHKITNLSVSRMKYMPPG